MQTLLKLSNLIDQFNEKIAQTVKWAVFIAAVICSLNAILRKVFSSGDFYQSYANSLSELQLFLFGCIFLLGAAYTLRRDEHVRIDVLSARWSERTQVKMDIVGFLLFLLPIAVLILYFSLQYVSTSYISGETTGNSPLRLWPFKLLIPVAYLLLIIQTISELIKRFAYFRGLVPFADLRRKSHSQEQEVKSSAINNDTDK